MPRNWAFLPRPIVIGRGTARDYDALARFHYVAKRPATWAGVWVARYDPSGEARVVAVAVLSWPTPCNRGRERFFASAGWRYADKIRFANVNLRTISRVIVHPQFRSLGLAVTLIRCILNQCKTRYVEATARMGRVHPLFEHAGMMRVPGGKNDPAYYLWDRTTMRTGEGEAPAEHP